MRIKYLKTQFAFGCILNLNIFLRCEKDFISILIEITVLLFEEGDINLKAICSLLDSL